MPTTQQEANTIVNICTRHRLTSKQMIGIFTDLNEEVGKPSENSSVKETMAMLAVIVDTMTAEVKAEPEPAPTLAQVPVHRITEINLPAKPIHDCDLCDCYELNPFDLLIGLVVVLHTIYGLTLLAGAAFCVVYQPWYITLLMVSFITFMMSKQGQCLFTRLENDLRAKRGYDEVDSFYSYYYFRPAWKWLISK